MTLPLPQLVDEWDKVLRHAWSARLLAIAMLLTFLETVLPLFDARLPGPQWLHSLVLGAVVSGAFAMRLISQKTFRVEES